MPEAEQNKASQKQYEGKKIQSKEKLEQKLGTKVAKAVLFLPWRKQRAHNQGLPDAKETQERIKSRANLPPSPQQPPREVNHTFAASQQQYCPIYPSLNST